MLIDIDISAIDCSLLAARSSKQQRPRALIQDVSRLDLLIESGISGGGRHTRRTPGHRDDQAVDDVTSQKLSGWKKWNSLSECEAGHLRALLTLDFLSQLKARSRDGGGGVTGHVGHEIHDGNLFFFFFNLCKNEQKKKIF